MGRSDFEFLGRFREVVARFEDERAVLEDDLVDWSVFSGEPGLGLALLRRGLEGFGESFDNDAINRCLVPSPSYGLALWDEGLRRFLHGL